MLKQQLLQQKFLQNGKVTKILKNRSAHTFKTVQSEKTLLGPKDTSMLQQPFISLHGIIPENMWIFSNTNLAALNVAGNVFNVPQLYQPVTTHIRIRRISTTLYNFCTVIPRLTKIIRSGITFVSQNLR